jgi:hypothetical protein
VPVGIKSAVGADGFWTALVARMAESGGGPDFVTVDGGEGGTGAAPLVFSDHVALPFKLGFARVYAAFARAGLAEDVTFIGAGRLGFPDAALFAIALGCDMVNVAREAMLSVGCIQAQRCHTGRCPTGVATQSPRLTRGLDPELKAVRAGNYLTSLRAETLSVARACGERHPALVRPEHIEILGERFTTTQVRDVFAMEPSWPILSDARRAEIEDLIGEAAPRPRPGPDAGEAGGFPRAGDPGRPHQELRSARLTSAAPD